MTGWREQIRDLGFRGLYDVLRDCERPAMVDEALAFSHGCTDLRSAGERWRALTTLDTARPIAGDQILTELSWSMYAASRVRDLLLLRHQPGPVDPTPLRERDTWLHRDEPRFPPISLEQLVEFFAAFGGRPVSTPSFCPALHEIVICEEDESASTGIELVEALWPAMMIDDLVFCRSGVRVRAHPDIALAGVADRSTLYFEFWRRHRRTRDLSMGWGSNSQWGTAFRRDYITPTRTVYNFDGREDPRHAAPNDDRDLQRLTPKERVELTKNRCLLRSGVDHDDLWVYDLTVDEPEGLIV